MTEFTGLPPSGPDEHAHDTPPAGQPLDPWRSAERPVAGAAAVPPSASPGVARSDVPPDPLGVPVPPPTNVEPAWPTSQATSAAASWPRVGVGAVPPPPAGPPTGPPTTPPVPPASAPRRPPRQWLGVAIVAALVGGLIGGGVVWATRGSPGVATQITIDESTTAPGGALVDDVSIPALVRQVAPSVVSINVSNGLESDQGTGMIITHDGLVVTNNHVIAAATDGGTITVTRTGTNTTLPATLLGTSATDDVALLQIQGVSNLPTVTFGDSGKLQVGDGVVAIGNALALSATTPTVTQGIVSALGRQVVAADSLSNATETLNNMIQTDAAINPGNSGGPLIDSNGDVIGMNTAVAGQTSGGENSQNIGFAIPAARIQQLIGSLSRSKPPATNTTQRHPGGYLGVQIVSVTPSVVTEESLSVTHGAYVAVVVAGGPASDAGIMVGDVLTSIAGTTINSDADVATVMRHEKPGTTVSVVVERNTSQLTIPVTVSAWPTT